MRAKLQEAALKNWPIKLASLLLASVLWAAVAAVEPTEELVPVRLLVEPPPGRTLMNPLPNVQAIYRGSPRELIKLFASPPVARKTVPDSVSASEWVVELSVQDLVTTEPVAVQAQDIQPRVIRLLLGDVAARRIPVRSRVTLAPDSGYALLGDQLIEPDSVTIAGPRDQVNRISEVYTSSLRMAGLTESVSMPVALDTASFGVVRVGQPRVTVSVAISRVTERVLMGVPVVARGRRGGLWESIPPGVAVTVHGPARRLAGITRDSVRVVATYQGTGASGSVPVTVEGPPGLGVQARPESVTVRRRGGG